MHSNHFWTVRKTLTLKARLNRTQHLFQICLPHQAMTVQILLSPKISRHDWLFLSRQIYICETKFSHLYTVFSSLICSKFTRKSLNFWYILNIPHWKTFPRLSTHLNPAWSNFYMPVYLYFATFAARPYEFSNILPVMWLTSVQPFYMFITRCYKSQLKLSN